MDLEGSGSEFADDISKWSYESVLQTPINTKCAGTDLMGGYHVLDIMGSFKRVYTGLPTHKSIYFTINFYFLDGWDLHDTLIIKFDSQLLLINGA